MSAIVKCAVPMYGLGILSSLMGNLIAYANIASKHS